MSRHRSTAPDRRVRVADQLQRDLSELIRLEVKDPRIGLVTLTDVEVTADYSVAKVWYTVFPSDEQTLLRTAEGLRRASGFLRSQIGRRIKIHQTPEIRFFHDPAPEQGLAMSLLIDQARAVEVAEDEQPIADQTFDPDTPQ